MKSQRRFAPTGGEFTPESVARFSGNAQSANQKADRPQKPL